MGPEIGAGHLRAGLDVLVPRGRLGCVWGCPELEAELTLRSLNRLTQEVAPGEKNPYIEPQNLVLHASDAGDPTRRGSSRQVTSSVSEDELIPFSLKNGGKEDQHVAPEFAPSQDATADLAEAWAL